MASKLVGRSEKPKAYIIFHILSECEDGSLRLVDGNSPRDGRLEVCQVGVWGTICAYMWDRNDTMVACRQLGINATGLVVFDIFIPNYFAVCCSQLYQSSPRWVRTNPSLWDFVQW